MVVDMPMGNPILMVHYLDGRGSCTLNELVVSSGGVRVLGMDGDVDVDIESGSSLRVMDWVDFGAPGSSLFPVSTWE